MSKQPKSHLKRLTTFDYINSAILLLVAVCCVYPFLYVFFVATTDGTYLARGEMTFLPMGFNLKAFGYILTNPRFNVFGGMRNSFMYTLLGTLLHLCYSVCAQPPALQAPFLVDVSFYHYMGV